MRRMVLVRGLPGAGKTTFALLLSNNRSQCLYAADDFFYDATGYHFDGSKIKEAHADCQSRVRRAIIDGSELIIVHNTFSCRWEMEPYLSMGSHHNYQVTVVDLYDGGCDDHTLSRQNEHNGDLRTIQKMRARWEHNWRVGDPHPPWER